MESRKQFPGGVDYFIIKETYNEDTDETTYVSNKVFIPGEDESQSYIFEDLDGIKYPMTWDGGGFTYTTVGPTSNPSVRCSLFTLDPNDDTGRIYIPSYYTASLTFTIG